MPSNVRRAVAVITIALASACAREPTSAPAGASSTSAPSVGVRAAYEGELPPLPEVAFAAARPAPITRAAYEFAARHPDVLRYVPCFCGCERHGHGNNEDCFVAKRASDGRPAWNPHGIGCGICIDVAREAARLHAAGASVGEIRDAIDRKYTSEYPTSTATPRPPHASSPH
jgi:hypothetical protein